MPQSCCLRSLVPLIAALGLWLTLIGPAAALQLRLVNADPEGFEEVGRFQAIDGKTWQHPVIANGKLYVRNSNEAACYRLE